MLEIDLPSRSQRVVRSSRSSQLLNPSLVGERHLYERATYCDQRLVLGSLGSAAPGQLLLRLGGIASRDKGLRARPHEPGERAQPLPEAPGAADPRQPLDDGARPAEAHVTELTPQPSGPPLARLLGIPLG